MKISNNFCSKLSKNFLGFTAVILLIGSGIVYAYSHSLLIPWSKDYQTATYKMQDSFGTLTKSQTVDGMLHLNTNVIDSELLKII